VNANDLIGSYETQPEYFPGFIKPYTEQTRRAIALFTWKMEINEKELIIHMPKHEDPLLMRYKIEGKYILCWEHDTKIKKYIPFYIENQNTIHGFNTIFFRLSK